LDVRLRRFDETAFIWLAQPSAFATVRRDTILPSLRRDGLRVRCTRWFAKP